MDLCIITKQDRWTVGVVIVIILMVALLVVAGEPISSAVMVVTAASAVGMSVVRQLGRHLAIAHE
jgi:hypothetical protein